MERVRPTTLKQRLSYLACAVALVWTVSIYQSTIGTKPLSAVYSHWEAIAAANPKLLASRYSERAVLERSYGVSDQVYQGQSIYDAWREFFEEYQIRDFRVLQQKQRNRRVEAEIQITAKSSRGAIIVLSVSYQAQFDRTGKIIKEVWQTQPEVSV